MFKRDLKWLWDYLAEHCLPLRCLLFDEPASLAIWVNAEISRFDLSEICETIDAGIAIGSLSLYTSDEEFRVEGPGSITEILQQRNFCHRLEVGYTTVGGAEWERLFQVDWDQYYTIHSGHSIGGSEEYETVSLSSPNEKILEVLLSGVEGLGYAVVPGTLLKATATPWLATYWKSLPKCHQPQFLGKAIESMAGWPDLPSWHI